MRLLIRHVLELRHTLGLGGILIASLLLTGGCATAPSVYDVNVTATLLKEGGKTGSFRLVSKPITQVERDHIEQARTLVRRALVGRGYREAGHDQAPDLFIYVGCGLSVGSLTSQTTRAPLYTTIPGPVYYERQEVGTDSKGNPIYQMVRMQAPPQQIISGYYDITTRTTALKKYLRLVAFAADPGDGDRETPAFWGIHATYESDDRGIGRALPMLTAASMVFVGSHTRGPVPIRIKPTDPDVVALRTDR